MNKLEAAYRATTYRVFLPEGVTDLRIDQAHSGWAGWLAAHGVQEWALLSAANPGSNPLPPKENAVRQANLECALLEEGFEPYAGENIADNGDWPVEETCLVPGISPDQAIALGQQFGQNAIILGGGDGMPKLVWIGSIER